MSIKDVWKTIKDYINELFGKEVEEKSNPWTSEPGVQIPIKEKIELPSLSLPPKVKKVKKVTSKNLKKKK